ncbi:MAG: DUF4340 domain-containing protein [Bacteroidia bacterium]|nr:DUF4340 domain-containing protein [Bacteroidia bacterium]
MKKIKWTLVIAVILAAAVIYLYYTNSKSTINKELRDFAIDDTASITKIFLVDKNNHSITLEKKENYWTVNKDFTARNDLVNILLKTICRLNVKAPVPKSSHNTIVKSLAANSTKVEIYQNDRLVKTYYVGGSTPDNMGTYMLLEGSSVPFIMDIPGFTGYLSTRYTTDMVEWRERNVFRYKFSDIASVTAETPGAPSQSFKAISYGNNKFGIYSVAEKKDVPVFDTLALKKYIAYFKNLNFESYITDISAERKDSVLKSLPITIITVEDRAGNKKTIKMFYRPNYKKLVDGRGNLYQYDPDRMFSFINSDKDMILIQYFVFDPVIKELNYFTTKRNLH